MNNLTDSHQNEPLKKTHTPSVLQFIFSLVAIILLTAGALLLALMGFLQRSDPLGSPVGVLQWSASMAFAAILVLPSALHAYRRIKSGIRGEPLIRKRRPNWVRISSLLLLTMPFILFLGNAVSRNDDLALIFLPPLHVLAIALPVFWLVSLALRGLSTGSPQRAWGIFDVGLVLGPGLILFLELAALFLMLVLSFFYILSQPELLEELTFLSQRLSIVSDDPESILRILEPYLTRPTVLILGLIFVAVIVPLIEELLKPIGVWFLSGKVLTPGEGFSAGVLSGAGFALFENLALSSGGSDWALAVTTRAGTTVVHIFTAGIMGWALVLAWTRGRYLTLMITYIAAVFIHSLWNALALFGMATYQLFPESIQRFSGAAIAGLIIMIIMLFALLMSFNRRLRQPILDEIVPADMIEPETEDDITLVM
jgi:RsiW-degrading membrane proteinase PrsW (M82 family)